jgi:hypothetical protein
VRNIKTYESFTIKNELWLTKKIQREYFNEVSDFLLTNPDLDFTKYESHVITAAALTFYHHSDIPESGNSFKYNASLQILKDVINHKSVKGNEVQIYKDFIENGYQRPLEKVLQYWPAMKNVVELQNQHGLFESDEQLGKESTNAITIQVLLGDEENLKAAIDWFDKYPEYINLNYRSFKLPMTILERRFKNKKPELNSYYKQLVDKVLTWPDLDKVGLVKLVVDRVKYFNWKITLPAYSEKGTKDNQEQQFFINMYQAILNYLDKYNQEYSNIVKLSSDKFDIFEDNHYPEYIPSHYDSKEEWATWEFDREFRKRGKLEIQPFLDILEQWSDDSFDWTNNYTELHRLLYTLGRTKAEYPTDTEFHSQLDSVIAEVWRVTSHTDKLKLYQDLKASQLKEETRRQNKFEEEVADKHFFRDRIEDYKKQDSEFARIANTNDKFSGILESKYPAANAYDHITIGWYSNAAEELENAGKLEWDKIKFLRAFIKILKIKMFPSERGQANPGDDNFIMNNTDKMLQLLIGSIKIEDKVKVIAKLNDAIRNLKDDEKKQKHEEIYKAAIQYLENDPEFKLINKVDKFDLFESVEAQNAESAIINQIIAGSEISIKNASYIYDRFKDQIDINTRDYKIPIDIILGIITGKDESPEFIIKAEEFAKKILTDSNLNRAGLVKHILQKINFIENKSAKNSDSVVVKRFQGRFYAIRDYLKNFDPEFKAMIDLEGKFDLFEDVDLLPISVNISADNTEIEKLFNAYDLSKNNYAVPIIIFEQLMTRQKESEKQAYKTLMIRALKHPTMDKAEFMKEFFKNYEKYTTEKDRMSPYGTSISGYIDNHLLNVYSVGIKVLADLDPDIEKIISLHNEFDLF